MTPQDLSLIRRNRNAVTRVSYISGAMFILLGVCLSCAMVLEDVRMFIYVGLPTLVICSALGLLYLRGWWEHQKWVSKQSIPIVKRMVDVTITDITRNKGEVTLYTDKGFLKENWFPKKVHQLKLKKGDDISLFFNLQSIDYLNESSYELFNIERA
ncbi:MAG: hypothetical protein ACFB0B_07030 [Thermonemataceae bacterium]